MHTPSNDLNLERLRPLVLQWAERIRAMNLPWKTGIYPAEMAAFLGMCEYAGIRSIVESGRGPDAYSTHVLGLYAEQTNADVVSIDFAPIEKRPYGKELAKFSHLQCLAGDVAYLFPRAMRTLRGPVALLVDGPKEERANCLSLCACLRYDIRLVSHHNAAPDTPWTEELRRVFPGLLHYEDMGLDCDPRWAAFRTWEREAVAGYEAKDTRGWTGRSLQHSSIAFALVPDRAQLLPWKSALKPAPLPFRPWALLLLWRFLSLFA